LERNVRFDSGVEPAFLRKPELPRKAASGERLKGKGKGKCIYISRFLQYLTLKALRHGSMHSVTCNYINACLYLVSVHQMAPPHTEVADI